MPFAFMHLLGAWIPAKIYEKISRYSLRQREWFFLLMGAVIPDFSRAVDFIFKTETHRQFSHSLLFVLLFGMFCFICSRIFFKTENAKKLALLGSLGVMFHICLDMIAAPGTMLFWPIDIWVGFSGVLSSPLYWYTDYSSLLANWKFAVFDMGLGTLWLFYLSFMKRIRF